MYSCGRTGGRVGRASTHGVSTKPVLGARPTYLHPRPEWPRHANTADLDSRPYSFSLDSKPSTCERRAQQQRIANKMQP